MPYTPTNFSTTAVINADTLFQNYDDEVQVLMSDVGNYLTDEMVKVYTETETIVTDGIKVNSVETIEDLATQDGVVFKTIIVKDLNRGGTFIWSATGTANGGTVFAGATGYWNRQYSGAVNVKWFGAVGDGVTDDTTAIQNAINCLLPIYIPSGTFKLLGGLTATHKININCSGTLKYEGTTIDNEVVLDITTSTDDLDFEIAPVLNNLTIVGNDIAYCGIRINSIFAPRIINYTSKGFTAGWALVFRNIALTSGARWTEAYYVENIASNYNKGGVRFHVDGGTASFGYGFISGNITNKIGDDSNQSLGMLVETTQLYQTKIDLNIWCNGYGTALKVGSSSYTGAKIYWCDIRLGGEQFNSGNYAVDLTDGQIFGCTGSVILNQGQILNPSNNRLEIYGQYQKVNYGNTTKQINGYDTKLTPLIASFQVEDAFSGKPEAGFGISSGTNMACPIVWMYDAVGNSFRVSKASFDSEPSTDDYVLDAYYDGTVKAKTKFKAPKFASYETTFYATASATTTQVFNLASILDTSGSYFITCHGYGSNTNLAVSGFTLFSLASQDIITPVTQTISQDYNYGSIALQTYGNIAANTYNVGNGRKFQIVVTNANATEMLMNLTITRIG